MILKGIIYKYTSPTEKVYIGQTVNEKSRRSEHKTQTIKHSSKFGNAIRKYGYENFTYEVLWSITAEHEEVIELLNIMEKQFISEYNSFLNGYNSTKGGGSTYKQAPEITAKNKAIRYDKYLESYSKWWDETEAFNLEQQEYDRRAKR